MKREEGKYQLSTQQIKSLSININKETKKAVK